jgi:hypothetical protein
MSPGDRAPQGFTRRRVLAYGVGGFVGAAFAGFELIEHGVLPGKRTLDELSGGCAVPGPALTFAPAGPSHTGRFFSARRSRTVGYTIAYPLATAPEATSRWRSACTDSAAITPVDSAA